MKKFLNTIMLTVLGITLALLFVLIIALIILGPQKLEESIKSLFGMENYYNEYAFFHPSEKQETKTNELEIKRTDILGVSDERGISDKTDIPPLLVPSSGIAAHEWFLFTGKLSDGKHEGIDIWTNTAGKGMDAKTYKKGNPVYASCDGYVGNIWYENGDVAIYCDELDPIYKDVVPTLKIKTLYGHMADQFSDEVYIYVKKYQRVKKGQLIGHQGNRCFYAPRNRIVHLHFGVYDTTVMSNQQPIDPTPYIGTSCTTLNQIFEIDNNLVFDKK